MAVARSTSRTSPPSPTGTVSRVNRTGMKYCAALDRSRSSRSAVAWPKRAAVCAATHSTASDTSLGASSSGVASASAGKVTGSPPEVYSAVKPTLREPSLHSTCPGAALGATPASHWAKETTSSYRSAAVSAATTCCVGWSPAATPGPNRSTTTSWISANSSLR
ncbi:hypothetical protein SVIOM74S_09710 [Streptomyces violarus]